MGKGKKDRAEKGMDWTGKEKKGEGRN